MDSTTQQRIDDLVKNNDVVLFMKGNASFPMCGFSGRAVQILKASGVEPKALTTVNVLEDEAIRQGIKMEMYESGELQQLVAAQA